MRHANKRRKANSSLVTTACVLLFSLQSICGKSEAAASHSGAAAYGRVPLTFEMNEGQTDGRVRFLSHGAGYSLLFDNSEALLALSPQNRPGPRLPAPATVPSTRSSESISEKDVVRMEFLEAGTRVQVTGEDLQPGKANYFLGNDSAKWRTGVPTFGKVRYSGVYPGVDLIFYGNQQQLEFDFAVSAGADARPIRLRFDGAKGLKLDRQGNLTITAKNGQIGFRGPTIYQMAGTTKVPVRGSFRLLSRNSVGFRIGAYDHTKPLVIDPILTYSTYFGTGDINGIATDLAGNAYITGGSIFPNITTTAGSYQPIGVTKESFSAYVSKFNSDGTALIYSTYIGGHGGDVATVIAVDSDGNAYIGGQTSSYDYPTTQGAFQLQNNTAVSNITGFVTKLNSTGTALVYSSYLGGSTEKNPSDQEEDLIQAIAVDANGSAYVTGGTTSSDFPITPGAFQTVNNGGPLDYFTSFVTKINGTGTALEYSTYLGGSSIAKTLSIAVDSTGNAFVGGTTDEHDFPTTPGAFQLVDKTDSTTGFLTKLNPTGTGLVYSTYLGGNDFDTIIAVTVDSLDNAYVTGTTGSFDFPVTSGAFQSELKEIFGNAFITKFNTSGSGLEYSTFIGGADSPGELDGDQALGIAVDGSGNVTIAGMTGNLDYPTTPGALLNTNVSVVNGGEVGSFLTRINSTGTALIYSTFLSGSGANGLGELCDCVRGFAQDGAGNDYLTGTTYSNDFPTTTAATQFNSGTIFVTKFNGSEMKPLPVPTMTLTSNINPAPPDTPIVFTAQVQAAQGGSTPTGTVSFSVSEGQWIIANLNGSGVASITTTAFFGGPNPVVAYYLGDANNSAASASMTENYTGGLGNLPTLIGATPSANPAPFDTPVTFKVSVKDPSGKGIPAGYAGIIGGSADLLGKASLDPDGNATITIGPLAAGANALQIFYGNYGDNYAPNYINYTQTVTPLGVLPAPVFSPPFGTYPSAPLTVTITDASPDALIIMSVGGTTPGYNTNSNPYTGPFTLTDSETIGAIAVQAGYTASSSVIGNFNLGPNGQEPTPSIAPTSGTYTSAQLVTITGAVTNEGLYYTTDGSTPNYQSIEYQGPFTISTSQTVKAITVAEGHSNSNVASATYVINLPAPDFKISLAPTALTIASGQSGMTTISIAPLNAFSQSVSFACSGLPAGASCGFSPATVTPAAATVTTNLTVAVNATASNDHRRPSPFAPAAILIVAVCLIRFRLRRPFSFLLHATLGGIGLSLLAGCGGGGNQTPPPTPVTSTVTVTATAGSLTHSATVTVTVN